jgi:hypothetical protein
MLAMNLSFSNILATFRLVEGVMTFDVTDLSPLYRIMPHS